MSAYNIQNLFADRIGGKDFGKGSKEYKFQKIKRAKDWALKKNPGMGVLDFGIGEPDDMAFSEVREVLKEEVDDLNNRGYADNGIFEFKEACKVYMKEVFDVELDSCGEINHCIGAKSVLSMIPSVLINPGDVILMTIPGYPVCGNHAIFYGGEVHNLILEESNHFLPRLDCISEGILKRSKVLVLNYPNNPTGANATERFYREVVDFARRNELVVVQDAAYSTLIYEGDPLSFLSVEGGKDVGLEIHSLSKGYNMTGWRLGFFCGNRLLVKALAHMKDHTDSGQFIPIQKAGIQALRNYGITQDIVKKYSRRLDQLVRILRGYGFSANKPGGTFYLFVKIPKRVKGGVIFGSAEEFSEYLIKERLISTVPWDETGGYIRFSVTFQASGIEEEERVWQELKRRLGSLELVF